MNKRKNKKITDILLAPYTVEMENRQQDRILGEGGGGGNSVEEILEGISAFPPHEEHEVVSIERSEGIRFSAKLKPTRQPDRRSDEQSATITVQAPNEAEARVLLNRAIRAHFEGPGWWEFGHPDYRRHAGTGRNEE